MVLLRKIISEKGFVDIETAKKETGLSRKYLIGYLEYLDKFSDIKKDGQRRFI
jgi:selenocysteine-specific elongation factor